MKRVFLLTLLVMVLSLAATASADARHDRGRHDDRRYHSRHHDWSHSAYRHHHWRPASHHSITVVWHGYRNHYSPARYRMERIHDREWDDRFPGLYAYRWHDRHGEGFWYNGHRVTNGVFFYNHDDELVSVGFMHNGAFIFIREDNNSYESRDSFFFAWSRH